jgi:hypothetical protein
LSSRTLLKNGTITIGRGGAAAGAWVQKEGNDIVGLAWRAPLIGATFINGIQKDLGNWNS